MESVAAEDFSDVKDSELIFSTRAGMITVSRNYEGRGGKANFTKEDKKGILSLYHSEEPGPHLQGDPWGYAELIMTANIS